MSKLESAIFWTFIPSADGSRVVQVRDDESGQFVAKSEYLALQSRFQKHCKHDGGNIYNGGAGHCAICGWDMGECQHRGENGNFCSQCGDEL